MRPASAARMSGSPNFDRRLATLAHGKIGSPAPRRAAARKRAVLAPDAPRMTRHQSLMNGGYDDHRINTLLRRRGALARRKLGHIGRHLQRRLSLEKRRDRKSTRRNSRHK